MKIKADLMQHANTKKNTYFYESIGLKRSIKVFPQKEPYVLRSLVPINILINRKPEHNQESSRSRREERVHTDKKREEAQRVKRQWSKWTGKSTAVKMETVMQWVHRGCGKYKDEDTDVDTVYKKYKSTCGNNGKTTTGADITVLKKVLQVRLD